MLADAVQLPLHCPDGQARFGGEECLSDVLLRVWDSIGTFDPGKAALTTWLTHLTGPPPLSEGTALGRRRRPAWPHPVYRPLCGAHSQICWGLALVTITLNFLGLDTILPAVGAALLWLGLAPLRRENSGFRFAYACATLYAVLRLTAVLFQATPLDHWLAGLIGQELRRQLGGAFIEQTVKFIHGTHLPVPTVNACGYGTAFPPLPIAPILPDERDREECLSDVLLRVWDSIEGPGPATAAPLQPPAG